VSRMGRAEAKLPEVKLETKAKREANAKTTHLRHQGQLRGSAGSWDGVGTKLMWSTICSLRDSVRSRS
jgi:hypothetical protein